MRRSDPEDKRFNVYSPDVINNTSPMHYLTDQQRIFVESIVKGDAPNLAMRKAGYKANEALGRQQLKKPKIQAAIRYSYQKYAKAAQMTRKKVMDGMLEAIEMAKIQSDPGVMVSGWREIGRMCGYYAPEVRKIDISVTTRRVVDQMEVLSDDELLKIVDEGSEVLEGEVTHLLEHVQSASDDALAAEFGP